MKESKYRILSIVIGIIIFLSSIYIMLALLLPLLGQNDTNLPTLEIGKALFFSYKFSSFLIPIMLLYGAILLIIPGWSTHSKAVLAGMPVYFFTSVICENLVYSVIPHIANPSVREFSKVAIILCTGLLLLLEVFVSLIIGEKKLKEKPENSIRKIEQDIIGNCYKAAQQEKINIRKKEVLNENATSTGKAQHLSDENISTQNTYEAELTRTQFKKTRAVSEFEPTETIKNFEELPVDINVDIGENISPQKRNSLLESLSVIEDDEIKLKQSIVDEVDEKCEEDNLILNSENDIDNSNLDDEFINNDEEIIDKVIINEEDEVNPDIEDKNEDNEIDQNEIEQDEFEIENDQHEDEESEIEKEEISEDEQQTDVLEYDVEEDELEDEEESDYEEEEDEEEEELDPEITVAQPLEPKKQEKTKGYYIPYDLLTKYPGNDYWIIDDSTRNAALALKNTFEEFNISIEITGIRKGPVVTMFEVLPPPGIKLGKITALQDNIALRLAAQSVRIVAPIPGKQAVGIEVPNKSRAIVGFRELIETDINETKKMQIPIMLGKDVTGEPQTLDLCQTPHLLIAGATGSGKSVCVNSIILSILYNQSPNDVKLLLVDPKIVELKLYNGIAHLLTPVITEPKKALQGLQYCICEMERRYAMLDGLSVRDIKSYNKKIKKEKIAAEPIPYIVIIIDEFADLMATTGKELEATVSRLCAMSRAVGIHLVLATQRPSTNVITGLIKANIPSRIAFMVASRVDSQIILDNNGAEKLLGRGDMLYVSTTRPFPSRIQGTFVSDDEVEKVVEQVKTFGEPDYIDDEIFVDEEEYTQTTLFEDDSDPLYEEALEIVLAEGKASASYIQRRLKIGYNRAARIVEEMEERGIVGPANGPKPREVIYTG